MAKLKLDLHDIYNRGAEIDSALRDVIDEAVRISERVYMVGEGHVQREDTGAWFASHIEDVIREMLQGRSEASSNGNGRGELQ